MPQCLLSKETEVCMSLGRKAVEDVAPTLGSYHLVGEMEQIDIKQPEECEAAS